MQAAFQHNRNEVEGYVSQWMGTGKMLKLGSDRLFRIGYVVDGGSG